MIKVCYNINVEGERHTKRLPYRRSLGYVLGKTKKGFIAGAAT